MATLGDLVVRIVGDTTGLNSSLTASQKKMAAFGINAAAVVAGVVAIGKAAAKVVKDVTDYGSAIFDASEKTGLSTDAIQEWKFIAEQTGGTLENVTGAVGMMTRGLQANADTFASLGIVLKNADGTFRSTTEIFNETVNKLSQMTDETERDQLAFKLLGRSAQSLIPILNAGADGMEGMRAQAHDLGIVLDEEAIKNSDELGDSMDALKAALNSAKASLVTGITPALIDVANALTSVITKTKAAKDEFKAYEEFVDGGKLKLDELGAAIRFVVNEQEAIRRSMASMPAGINKAGLEEQLARLKAREAALRAESKALSEKAYYEGKATAAAKETAEAERVATEVARSRGETVVTVESDIDALRREQYDNWVRITQGMAELQKAAAEETAKTWTDMYNTIAAVAKPVFESLGAMLANGQVEWKDLASVAVNAIGSIVTAMGDQLAAKAAATLIEAIAALASVVSAPLAPGLFASAAILSGGAAAAWATGGALKAAKFAEGGVVQPVPGGIQATVAEAGIAEAIIPLDRLDRMLETASGGAQAGGGMSNLTIKLDSKVLYSGIFDATKNRTVLVSAGAVV